MTKSEFMAALSDKLSEQLSPAEIRSQVRYYEGYIAGEVARGKTEQEAVDDLGDPILIARTILESPHETETTIFGDPVVQDEREAYEEGSYQGENEHSEQEVRHAVHHDHPLEKNGVEEHPGNVADEVKDDARKAGEKLKETGEKAKEEAQKAGETAKEKLREAEEKAEEARRRAKLEEQMKRQRSAYADSATQESEEEKRAEAASRKKFGWTLFAAILVIALIVTAVIWIMTQIASHIGAAALIIILLVIVIILLLIRNHSQTPRS